jgi:hypothetical protein
MQSVKLCYKYQPGIRESTLSQGWFHLVTKHVAEERLIKRSLDNALLITYTLGRVTVVNTGISRLPPSPYLFVQLLVSGTPLPISSCPHLTWRAGCPARVRLALVAAVISIKNRKREVEFTVRTGLCRLPELTLRWPGWVAWGTLHCICTRQIFDSPLSTGSL